MPPHAFDNKQVTPESKDPTVFLINYKTPQETKKKLELKRFDSFWDMTNTFSGYCCVNIKLIGAIFS